MSQPKKFRNLAIIAHIDHGKTTLVDALLKSSNIFRENEAVEERAMDSYDQERERGITIFAKNTSIPYKEYKINLIDTPGHADFSGEVERVLGMVNSVLLLVDAQEGPMPQTRFVLTQALKAGLRPIVVINKIDRPHANPENALNLTFDLFVELGANEEQLDFPVCYASGLGGFATREEDGPRDSMIPLLDMIIDEVPAPPSNDDEPFLMQAATVTYNDFTGRQACGRILAGTVKKGDQLVRIDKEGKQHRFAVSQIESTEGLRATTVAEAFAGDIVSIGGSPEVMIGDTVCSPAKIQALPPIQIAEPTLSMEISVNSSPMVKKDGKRVTMGEIKARLEKERRANISLRIESIEGRDDAMRVCGRGELHISVLLEAMRREDFEFSVSKPQVIIKQINGQKHEPLERVHIEVPEEFSGGVIQELSRRKGEMQGLSTNEHGISEIEFLMPTRGLMGYRSEFLTQTRGLGILTSIFDCYTPWKGTIVGRINGALISMNQGNGTAYSIGPLQSRGVMFVSPGDEVYEGQVIGENAKDNDLVVNVTKGKQLTNFRASGTDDTIQLIPPRVFNLETALDFINEDELVEITPHFLRIRKRWLKEVDRKRHR